MLPLDWQRNYPFDGPEGHVRLRLHEFDRAAAQTARLRREWSWIGPELLRMLIEIPTKTCMIRLSKFKPFCVLPPDVPGRMVDAVRQNCRVVTTALAGATVDGPRVTVIRDGVSFPWRGPVKMEAEPAYPGALPPRPPAHPDAVESGVI